MKIGITPQFNIKNIPSCQRNMTPTFGCQNDTFEKSTPIQVIELRRKDGRPRFVEYNGKDKAYIFKKVYNDKTGQIEKQKVEVCVASLSSCHSTTYYFFDDKTKKELGRVEINTIKNARIHNFYEDLWSDPIEKDYPEFGIVGNRISINYLENSYPDEYSGIGEAADQIAIEYCINNNIPLQLVSEAEKGSVIAHYKRGRKFLPVEGRDYRKFMDNFGTNDPNKIIEERIKQNPDNKNIYCDDIYKTYMYMPEEVVEKYLERIKEKPILHE